MRWLIQLLKLCVLTVLPKMLSGQYTVNNAVDAVDGVPNVLLGGGVTYSNLIFSGNNAQIGAFSCTGNCNLGISSGLVIGTGNVSGSDGPNNNAGFSMGPPAGIDNTYDADLDLLTASDLNNVARLEFDFVPTGDSVTFNFVFGSEEYPEYSDNPQFNDVFGFFISGPGISGPYQNAAINIALLPNGLPITINNVNPFNNSQYYNTNNGNAIQADGFTDVLTALTEVECGETYHIKIVIADAFDDLWDSWVFLEANSFESNQVTLDYVTPTIPAAGNGILEGCSSAELNFSRTGNINQSYSIQHVLAGTATLGSDYVLNPSSWTFLPGQANLSIEVIALADGIAEGNEQIMLSYLANGCVGSEVDQIIVISDLLPISVPDFDVVIPCNAQAVLTPAPTGGAGLYNFSWPDGSQQNSFTVLNPTDNQNINLVVSDTCGVESIAVVANIAFTQQSNLELDVNNSGAPLCGESISLLAIGSGGLPPYDFSWSSGANFLSSLPSLELQLFNDSSVSLIVTDECGTQLSFDTIVAPQWELLSVNLGNDIVSDCLTDNLISPNVNPNYGGLQYQWNYGVSSESSDAFIEITTGSSMVVSLNVTDLCGNSGNDIVEIIIPNSAIEVDAGNDIEGNCLGTYEFTPVVNGNIGNVDYLWFANEMEISGSQNLIVPTDVSSEYVILATDECGGMSSDTVYFSLAQDAVSIELASDTDVTCLTNLLLSPVVSGGVGLYSFEWSNENDVVLSNASSYASVFSAEVNQISVAVSDECGNSESTIIQVNVPPVPLTVLLPDDTTTDCISSLILLPIISGGVGVFSYQWSDDSGNILSENLEYSSIYTNETNVSFSAIDACGNTSTVSTMVNLLDSQISIALTSDTTTDCLSLMELQPFINGGIGNYEFTWINSLGAVVSNSQTYSEYFPESETIVLNVNDECGNFADATSYIYVPAVPVYLTAISDTAVDCITPITLSAAVSGGVGEYSFQWLNTFSGESGSDVNYTNNYTENTIIEIIVSDECSNEASTEILVQVPPVPLTVLLPDDTTTDCISSLILLPTISGGVGVFSYQWSDDTGNVLSENLEYSSIYTSDTNVSFSAIDACGNTSTVSTMVNLLDSQISIALTSDTTTDCLSLMELQPFINGGIGNYEFTWINSLGAVVSNSQTYSEYFPESETIVLNVNDECGNFADATSYIYVPAVPVYLTAISDTAVDCITPITLSAAVSGGVGEYSFQWLNTFSGESGSDVNYTDNYTENTIIEIIVSDECSNEASAEILVQVPPVPIEIGDISDATNTCIESVLVAPQVLGGVGGYVFEWFQDGTLISLDSELNEVISFSSMIVLEVTDACGNFSEESFFVSIPPVPITVELGENIVTDCMSNNIINPTISGGVGTFFYNWSDDTGYVGGTPVIDYIAANHTSLQLIVTDQCGNSGVDVMSILVPSVPVYVSCQDDTTVCRDDMIYLGATASGGVGQLNYVWTGFEDQGNTPPVFPENDSNLYSVTVMDECGNFGSDSYTVYVTTVEPLFVAVTEDNITYNFLNVSESADEVNWSFSTGETFGNLNEVGYYNSSVDAWSVTLIAIRENGCRRSLTQEFRPASVLYVPNAFTPDGDGINDVFMPVGVDIVQYSCKIFNRYGQLIYQTNDISIAWSGGSIDDEYYVANGIYLYTIDAIDGKGEILHQEGSVIMAR